MSKSTAAATTHVSTFKAQALGMLNRIESMLASCHKAQLTMYNSNGIKVAIAKIEDEADPVKMIEGFIKHHSHWDKIFSKDMKFICETLPDIYKSDYLDTKLLAIPVEIYFKNLKVNGYQDLPEEKWPVTNKDEAAIWMYFKNMLTLSCRYMNVDKEKYKEVPFMSYVEKYSIVLNK
jgi:hypothetical protein